MSTDDRKREGEGIWCSATFDGIERCGLNASAYFVLESDERVVRCGLNASAYFVLESDERVVSQELTGDAKAAAAAQSLRPGDRVQVRLSIEDLGNRSGVRVRVVQVDIAAAVNPAKSAAAVRADITRF